MNIEHEIGRRLYYSPLRNRTARPAVRVAEAGVVISVAVMIITLCVVVGFKQTITDKVAGFGAHIELVSFDNNNTYEYQPIIVTDSLLSVLEHIEHVQSVNTFATKPAMLKTPDTFQGIVLKGLPEGVGWTFFQENLLQGNLPEAENQILLSQVNANLLQLGLGDNVLCYFIGDQIRVRRFTISGIYDSAFSDYDRLFVLCYQSTISQLNGWDSLQVSGVEIRLDNLDNLAIAYDDIYYHVANRLDEDGAAYYPQSLIQQHAAIFQWLDLLDMNVWVIIVIMLLVSGFNVVSGLIILILDAIPMVGVVKALGADNRFVRRIFLYESGLLVSKGMVWGNALGLALVALQYFFHCVPLDAGVYYVSYAPVAFPWVGMLAVNLLMVVVSVVSLLAPVSVATRISPARVMHFQ